MISETDDCARNLDKEHENEYNKEFKEYTSLINDTNESEISKDKTEEALIIRLSYKNVLLKVIQAFIFCNNKYDEYMIAVGIENKYI